MSIGAASEAPDGASLASAMEGCTAQDLERVVCDALAEASGAVIVVPSSAPTTALVSRLSDRWGVGIAADPVAFLRACGEGKRQHAFVFTDRFVNGDKTNDINVKPQDPHAYHGGDFAGRQSKLGYIRDLGGLPLAGSN